MRELWLITVAELLSLGEIALARKAARIATSTLVDDGVLWAARALVEDGEAAEAALETALALASDEPLAWLARAHAYRAAGDSIAADAAASMAVVRGTPRLQVDAIVFPGGR